MKILLWLSGLVVALAVAVYAAFQFSPWPSALIYRYVFDQGGRATAAALEKHVPPGVTSKLNEQYDPGDSDALLDVFYPSDIENAGKVLTTIVWIHGGGFFAGTKDDIANYARILAAKGYTVVGVDYSLAPGARYPTPLRQVNAALAFLMKNAARYHIDPARLVLAGDSAGAQIAAQTAAIISDPVYAKAVGIEPAIEHTQLIGAILYCGVYDRRLIKFEGPFAGFLRTVGWSYFGTPDFLDLPSAAQFSVVENIPADYPPVFISAGNDDPLLPHSLSMADTLEKRGVAVDRLFFPKDYTPPLPHEYQFNLDIDAGKIAFERTLNFLAGLH